MSRAMLHGLGDCSLALNCGCLALPAPYYEDELVTLYHGDCLELAGLWTCTDVLVTDPPYGRNWQSGSGMTNSKGYGAGTKPHGGIRNDRDTTLRDSVLAVWGPQRLALVFGDPLITQPANAVQALVYHKAADAGIKGARAGRRRDVEMIYLCGPWPVAVGGTSSVLRSGSWVAGPTGPATRFGHPHAKPQDLMEELVSLAPGAVADPSCGSGSTLVAAKALGRKSIGVELDERYCEIAANRLSQNVLDFGGVS